MYYITCLQLELDTEVDTLHGWVCALRSETSSCKVAFTIVRHVGPEEEIVTIYIDFQHVKTNLADPTVIPCIGKFKVLQTTE